MFREDLGLAHDLFEAVAADKALYRKALHGAEAQRHENDAHRLQLMLPTLMQYAEIAWQLCQVGESQAERLSRFLQHQPAPPSRHDA